MLLAHLLECAGLNRIAMCMCEIYGDLVVEDISDAGLAVGLDEVKSYGPQLWWLSIGRCRFCGQHWVWGRDDRVHDVSAMRKIDATEADRLLHSRRMPVHFTKYRDILELAVNEDLAARFSDPSELGTTVDELLKESPELSNSDLSRLLHISTDEVQRLTAERKENG